MQTIQGQIIASTTVDVRGDQISEEELRSIFETTPESWVMWNNHDPAKPPICRAYNKKFVQLDGNHWVIRCDIDILDEEEYSKMGGFSVAFTRGRITRNQNRKPEIEILSNQMVVPLESLVELVELTDDQVQIDAVELVQKGLDVPAIIFLSCSGTAIASGFLNELGADIYKSLRDRLKKIAQHVREKHDEELEYRLSFRIKRDEYRAEVYVSLTASEMEAIARRGITADDITDHISQFIKEEDIQKVFVRLRAEESCISITHYTDRMGLPQLPRNYKSGRAEGDRG